MKRTLLIILTLLLLISAACGNKTDTDSEIIVVAAPTATPRPTLLPTPELTETPSPSPTPVPVTTPTPTPEVTYIGKVVCTADEFVNIRQQPSTDSQILGQLPAWQSADVIEYNDSWVNISYEGITGYVYKSYTIESNSPSVPVPSGEWAEILVNQTNLIPDGFTVELADFEGGQVDARILEISTAMFADAKEDGVDLMLVDAYRSYETQSEQFESTVKRYTNKGYSREAAEKEASTITARPNTSEHQTGLVLDIVTPSYQKRNKGFAETDAFKWLTANAANYGFIMRYPKGKEDITKVIFESWHWRFVGTQAAQEIKQSGQCYEEYLGILN